MARGKYLNLEEARKLGKIDQFCKEHPSEGDADLFYCLLNAAAHSEPPTPRGEARTGQTSAQADAGSEESHGRHKGKRARP